MSDLATTLEPYKLRSRRYRKRALQASDAGRNQEAAEEFERSRQAIREAIRYLDKLGAPNPEGADPAHGGEVAIAEQLADCWGMLGGVYRAEERLQDARKAYDEGFRYESSERFNILNTYNRVNRLVVRILHDPELLGDPPPPVADLAEGEGKTMPELLVQTADVIERQLREGRRDRAWALADLVMVRSLGGLEGVDVALRALNESAGDPFPYQSMLTVIDDLLKKGLPVKNRLVELGERLRQVLDKRA